jgi:hypothetical protein
MRLTLSSAHAQRILEVINDNLTRGPKAPTYSIQIGFNMAAGLTKASPGETALLLIGLSEYLRDKLPADFAVTLDVQLYANTKATEKVVVAVQDELQAMQQEQQKAMALVKGGSNE